MDPGKGASEGRILVEEGRNRDAGTAAVMRIRRPHDILNIQRSHMVSHVAL